MREKLRIDLSQDQLRLLRAFLEQANDNMVFKGFRIPANFSLASVAVKLIGEGLSLTVHEVRCLLKAIDLYSRDVMSKIPNSSQRIALKELIDLGLLAWLALCNGYTTQNVNVGTGIVVALCKAYSRN